MNEWEENYGLTAFLRKLAEPQPNSDMRDWEVNTPKYKSKSVDERTEELFLDKEPILSAFIKKAAEEEKNKSLHTELGAGVIGGGAILANKNMNKLTGMETLYHGTGKEQAKGIRAEGLKASLAGSGVSSQRVGLAHQIGEENVANKVYLANNKGTAMQYAAQEGYRSQGRENGLPIRTGFESQREMKREDKKAIKAAEILKAKIPYQELQDGTLKQTGNPELRGLSREEWIAEQKSKLETPNWMDKMVGINEKQITPEEVKGLGNSYDSLLKDTTVLEGDLPSRYIKGAENFKGQTMKGLLDYAKANPRRFASGVGTVGAGVGVAGLGANHLRNTWGEQKTAFIEDRMMLEKIAKLFGGKKQPSEFDDLIKQRDGAVEALRANTQKLDELNPGGVITNPNTNDKYTKKLTDLKERRNPGEKIVEAQQPAGPKLSPVTEVKPKKIGKGKLALIGASVGAVGLGAKKLYDDRKEKTAFIEDRMRLEKFATYTKVGYTKDGVEYGVTIDKDKNGYFAKTHRARSKSYDTAEQIPVKDLKFIDSTG